MKLKLNTIVGMYDKTKDGKPLVTKNGKPYKKANVKFFETGDKVVSMNVWQGKEIKEGQEFEGEITEREWQGKKYFDFKEDNKEDKINDRFAKIEFSIIHIHKKIDEIVKYVKMKEDDGLNSDGSLPPNFDIQDVNAELETLAEDADYEDINRDK